jgi:hypothetical protein
MAMKKPHNPRATAAVAIAAAAALGTTVALKAIAPNSQPVPSDPAHIYTWDCEYPEKKPATITITCADGGISVNKITWNSWSNSGASGTGTFSENLCEPSCAEGKVVSAPVTISLSDLYQRKGKFYLRTLDIVTKDGKDFPWGRANGYRWDVMEFAEQMNWDS